MISDFEPSWGDEPAKCPEPEDCKGPQPSPYQVKPTVDAEPVNDLKGQFETALGHIVRLMNEEAPEGKTPVIMVGDSLLTSLRALKEVNNAFAEGMVDMAAEKLAECLFSLMVIAAIADGESGDRCSKRLGDMLLGLYLNEEPPNEETNG